MPCSNIGTSDFRARNIERLCVNILYLIAHVSNVATKSSLHARYTQLCSNNARLVHRYKSDRGLNPIQRIELIDQAYHALCHDLAYLQAVLENMLSTPQERA